MHEDDCILLYIYILAAAAGDSQTDCCTDHNIYTAQLETNRGGDGYST